MWQTNKKTSALFLKALQAMVVLCMFILVSRHDAEAANGNFTITLANAPVALTMGDPSGANTLVYTIRNTSGAGTNLTRVQFVLNGGGTGYTWSNATAAPTGWTVTFPNPQTARFTASNPIYYITNGSSLNFSLLLGAITADTRDGTNNLNIVQAWNTTGGNRKFNNPGGCSWTRRSLAINSFTVNPTNVAPGGGAGGTFIVTISLTNRSTSNGVTIVSSPQPPNQTWVTGSVPLTVSANPSVTLNAGQAGTLQWTYQTNGPGVKTCTNANPSTGSVYFTINNLTNTAGAGGAGRATSKAWTAPTATVLIYCLSGNISIPTCITSGQVIQVLMPLKNAYSANITNMRAFVTPGGTAAAVYQSGPAPAQNWTLNSGATNTVTWTYQINGDAGSTISFSSPNTTGVFSGSTITANVTSSATVTLSSAPTITVTTNAASDKYMNVGVSLNLLNTLCNAINKVAIAFPATWTYQDSSSLITTVVGDYDDWGVGVAGTTVTFTAGTPMLSGDSGNFDIFFSQIPAAEAAPNFQVTMTDATGASWVSNPMVTVGPPGSDIQPARLWKEELR